MSEKIYIPILAVGALIVLAGVGWQISHARPAPTNSVVIEDPGSADEPANPDPVNQNPPTTQPNPNTGGGSPTPPPQNNPVPVTPRPVLPEIAWGDRTKQQVIFTFDGGAGNHSIEEILAVFDKHNLTTTFFVTGTWAEQNPEWIGQINRDGHEIFNHTYSHPELTKLTDAQIAYEFARTETILKDLTGKTSKPYFRPPYGDRNQRVLNAAAQAGYRSIYWTVDALDWKPDITDAEVRSRILDNLESGTIYMMHIGDDITGRILDDILTEIKSRGYAIVPLTKGL